jgi:hypothetical protein
MSRFPGSPITDSFVRSLEERAYTVPVSVDKEIRATRLDYRRHTGRYLDTSEEIKLQMGHSPGF